MNRFLSCDWGTSSFRLRLVEVTPLRILAEVKTDQGIAATHRLWKTTINKTADKRFIFYLDVIQEHIRSIAKDLSMNLQGVPLIISGMASSSIGMMNLPYGQLPFHTSGKGIRTEYFPAGETFEHPMLLISGVQSKNDVMRGEETQLIGTLIHVEDKNDNLLFLFPGTHSKHIKVSEGQVRDFRTYMTGEYFELLSRKSILSSNVDSEGEPDQKNMEVFKLGVEQALQTNLLHASFLVRTNELFGKMTKKENFHFLSGLLIGAELKELLKEDDSKIYLCCSSNLKYLYEEALKKLGVTSTNVLPARLVDEAVIKGQLEIFNKLKIHG
ncbi:2-dehydro-3-deoxygalactonokinase [Sinomicrobium sp. M5D2P17]